MGEGDGQAGNGGRVSWISSAALALAIAGAWAGSAQLARATQDQGDLHAVSFIIWVNTIFNLFMLIPWAISLHFSNKAASGSTALASGAEAEDEHIPLWKRSWRFQAILVVSFYCLWISIYYCYTRSLASTPASLVTALFSAAPAFVFLFSLALLGDTFNPWAGLAALISVAGVALLSQPWTSAGRSNVAGSALAVAAGALVALYEVLLRRVLGQVHPRETAYFLGGMGVVNLCVGWVLPLALGLSHAEPSFTLSDVPWGPLLASSVLGLGANVLTNVGVSITHPLVVAVGSVLGVPVNVAIDATVHGQHLSWLQGGGILVMLAGFVLMLCKDAIPWCQPVREEEEGSDKTLHSEQTTSLLL